MTLNSSNPMTKTKLLAWTLAVAAVMAVGAYIGIQTATIYNHLVTDHNELHAISKWAVSEVQKRTPPKPTVTAVPQPTLPPQAETAK